MHMTISSSSVSLSPLQDKDLPQSSPVISLGCLSIQGSFNKTSNLIFPSSSLSALLSFTILGLPFCYSNSPSIITSSHEVSCPCPLFSFVKNVFNFNLLLNPWCSFTTSPCYAKHYSLNSTLATLKFSFHVRISRMHWLYIFLFSDNGNYFSWHCVAY